jgi:hypothetical protein
MTRPCEGFRSGVAGFGSRRACLWVPRRAGAGRAVPRGRGNGVATGLGSQHLFRRRTFKASPVRLRRARLTLPGIPDTVAFVSSKSSEPGRPPTSTPLGSIKVQVHVPADRLVRLPAEVPEGPVELIVIPRAAATAEARRAAFGRYDSAGFSVPDDFDAQLADDILGGGVDHATDATKPWPAHERARGTLILHPPSLFPVHLSRLFDDEVAALAPWCRAVEPDPFGDFSRTMTQRELTLPRVFLTARRVFGRSSSRFDPHKSSFAFPILLSAARNDVELRYLLMLQDVRGSVRVAFHRFRGQRDPQERPIPTEGELSLHDINLVRDAMLEFLYLGGDAAARGVSAVHRTVPSELTVYGCRNGDLFESRYESSEEYQRAVETIRGDLLEAEQNEEREHVGLLLRNVIGDPPERA